MNAFWACFLPLAYTIFVAGVTWFICTYGSPIRWVGFASKRRPGGGTRVEKEHDE